MQLLPKIDSVIAFLVLCLIVTLIALRKKVKQTATVDLENRTLHIIMSIKEYKELEGMLAYGALEGMKELFSEAVTLYGWAQKAVLDGREVASVDESQKLYKVIILRGLERLRQKHQPYV